MPTRREFLYRSLSTALAIWACPSVAWAASGPRIHVVKKGDTLSDIARNYGVTVDALKRTNQLRSGLIKAGQKLTIPAIVTASAVASVSTYRVKSGDTLGSIAESHATDVSTLKRINNLRSDLIKIGQPISIPDHPSRSPLQGASALLSPVVAATAKIKVDASRWRYIVCHHSAIEDGNATAYGNEHKRRGMENGLAYHFVIGNGRDSGDGEIEIGPRWVKQLRGGHVRSTAVNDSGIGICLVGNLQNHRPTARQQQALDDLLGFLRDGHVHRTAKLTVHKWVDRAHTLCPGKHFNYDGLKRFA